MAVPWILWDRRLSQDSGTVVTSSVEYHKTSLTMEQQQFEDVSPTKNG